MTLEDFEKIKNTLPENPGIYKYFDKQGKYLYVGKAKNLQKRVSSYFLENRQHTAKTILMVRLIDTLEFTVTNTERDALLLENSLIKTHQPRYNIRLKDDKTYPYIAIKNEPFPRVIYTRQKVKEDAEYYGPYTEGWQVKQILELIKTIIPLRSCNLNLTKENIEKNKFKVCLEYHIGNCKAPCVGYQDTSNYNEGITHIRNMLKGKIQFVSNYIKSEMEHAAENLAFEAAASWKKKLDYLENYRTKSSVVHPSLDGIGACTVYTAQTGVIFSFLKVNNGIITATQCFVVENPLELSELEILEQTIEEILEEHPEVSEWVVPFPIEVGNEKITTPQVGDKKKLLDLAVKNAKVYAVSLVTDQRFQRQRKELTVLQELKDVLKLKELPAHIECFDNSNIQGTNPVSACVVFKNGKPSKKDYRHFNVKTVEGPNDFDTMREVVYRRYKRMLDEGETLPQLIIIDGGKGQLGVALESLESLGIQEKVCTIGIAKRLEEIYYKNDSIPLYIDKKSSSLRLIQQLRDEAHRFGLTFHRNKRSAAVNFNMLDDIDGIGDKTAKLLYSKYRSINKLKIATLEDLSALVGAHKAQIVFDFLQNMTT